MSTQNLLRGLSLPEGIRWQHGRVFLSDVFNYRVLSVDLSGNSEVVASSLEDRPLGLGFLADGSPLVALTRTRQILRITPGGLELHADVSDLADVLNDMVSGPDGVTYVGTGAGSSGRDTCSILLVRPDGDATVAASGIPRANGLAITPDQSALIYAATDDRVLIRMKIGADWSLSNPTVFADLGDVIPDGICLDEDGKVWVAAKDDGFLRVEEGGDVISRVPVDGTALTCILGGPDRRTLFLASTKGSHAVLAEAAKQGIVGDIGSIDFTTALVAGAGWP
jgi:sugar lactone lactonase YvrE